MLAAVAAVAVVNLAATMRFNQATASLTANIKAAQDPSTDVDTLSARQQQTDAQFAEAGRMRALLMPQVRDAIDANTAVSSQLTTITLKQAQLQQDGAGASDATNGQTASGTSGSGNRKQSDGLTEEQRKKVEELMKANQQAAEDQSATTTNKTEQQATQNKGTGATKPW
ncbi:cell surface protein [Bifidobacterium sp. UTBIF-78]|nr:cell surface protein [Bifidobacterium sp. UTBIF-78]